MFSNNGMPDVFDRFFGDFGKKTSDYYSLEKLNPAYSVYFGKNEYITIEDTLEKIKATFERIEPGSASKLQEFIDEAGANYDVAIKDLVYRPGISPLELVTPATIKKIGSFFSTISKDVRKSFKNPKLVSILEFPVLFLGAKPDKTPSFLILGASIRVAVENEVLYERVTVSEQAKDTLSKISFISFS